jgi:hypothetical protein
MQNAVSMCIPTIINCLNLSIVYTKHFTKKILPFCSEFICSLKDLSLLLTVKNT